MDARGSYLATSADVSQSYLTCGVPRGDGRTKRQPRSFNILLCKLAAQSKGNLAMN